MDYIFVYIYLFNVVHNNVELFDGLILAHIIESVLNSIVSVEVR